MDETAALREALLGMTARCLKAEARVAELTSLLTEAGAEIEADIESKYEAADVLAYPSMARKYEQDMDLPRRIRAALGRG